MSDHEIEKKIQEKGLTAERVTPDKLEGVIVSEQYYVFPNTAFTSCLLTLQNGFNVLGESACASPENYDEELGREIARDNAKNKIWLLEGYLLKQRLSVGDRTQQAPETGGNGPVKPEPKNPIPNN